MIHAQFVLVMLWSVKVFWVEIEISMNLILFLKKIKMKSFSNPNFLKIHLLYN
jgi:hypothetical protein